MIDFANTTYGNSVLSFELFDIEKKVPEKYVSYFDYVFSFWTLHWIQNQRQLFSNIYKFMKPNSQMLVSYIAQSKLSDIFQKVWHQPEYSEYIKDFNASRSYFQESKDPKKELKTILQDCGYEVCMIKIDNYQSNRVKASVFKKFVASISPYLDKIPNYLEDQFVEDHVKEFADGYYMKHKNFVVYAKKQ